MDTIAQGMPLYLTRWDMCVRIFGSEDVVNARWPALREIHNDELCSYMPRYEAYILSDGSNRARDVNAASRAAFVSRILQP
jgi:hypothetical protein